ncbi:MAG TPA: Hsp70 family protein [Acidimicrobiales bacterium]|nr:Hsp70 family protein [Acidimicrobiales bacterium]
MTYHLGVDLGTTYTAAAIARDGRALPATLGSRSVAIPSVVYLGSGGDELLVGEAAARRAVSEPSRVAREFKRRVGDPTPILLGGSPIAAELLMARLLRWVVGQVASTEGSSPASLAVTHPANWGEYKLDLLRQAIRHVDLKVDHFVSEPVAAASFYAAQRDLAPGSVVAVYDLGGGTFDAALVRVEGTSFRIVGRPDGIERLGGIDFDHAILRHVSDVLGIDLDSPLLDADDPATVAGLQQLRQDCVEAKEALSVESDVSIPVLLPDRHTEVRLTRHEFEAMIRPALNETIVALRRAVESAGIGLDDVTAVLLVGGSSRIPMVAHLVTEQLGRPVAVDANPKDAVPLGASLVAWRAARPAPPQAAAAVAATPAPTPAVDPRPAPPRPTPAPQPVAAYPTPAPMAAAPTPPSSGQNRNLYLAAAALLVVVVVLVAIAATRGDDDDPGSADPGGPPVSTDDTNGTTDTTSLDDILGQLEDISDDLGGLGSGQGPALTALPGSEWSDEARADYVSQCVASPDLSAAATLGSIPAEDMCGCMYDRTRDAGASFADFNDLLTAADISEVDADNTAQDAFTTAGTGCVTDLMGAG